MAGADYPQQFRDQPIQPLEGESLLPAFAGQPLPDRALYWEHEGNRAVRVGKWKLVAKGRNGAWELYDMHADRSELNDLSAQQPQRAQQMAGLWQAYAERTNVLPWPGSGRKSRKKN
jgi:arylsulfatase